MEPSRNSFGTSVYVFNFFKFLVDDRNPIVSFLVSLIVTPPYVVIIVHELAS
jgi:hypothetical protein